MGAMDAPTGIVTLLFAEAASGAAPAALRDGLAAAGGFEVKALPGGCMAAFADPAAAVRFAVGAQAGAGDALRIGIATGEAIVERDAGSGRADYFGPTVNRAARIMAAAHPGQTVLSDAARAAAGEGIGGMDLSDLGEHRLRGIDRPERIHQALPASQRGRRFPPLRTIRTLPTNLPTQVSSFVGREEELKDLDALLRDPLVRVVTLTGGAGVGKTRLAVRAAATAVGAHEGGVWFADLAEVEGREGVGRAVAEVLGASPGADPVAAAGTAIDLRGDVLVFLDTMDLHLQDAPATVGSWVARAPRAKFLLTSRATVGLPGEREFRLEPLPVGTPDAPGPAIRLFVDRAREARPGFDLLPGNAADLARICGELEGLPLAIELAAARARIMSPAEMVGKLGQKFQILRSARQDAARRQQTLVGAIEWSEEQLAAWQRSALRQLSVFRGGCTPEAADAVVDLSAHAGAPGGAAAARSLVARGLLAAQETDAGTRFAMSRTMSDYASARLAAGGPEGRAAAEARHAAFFTSFAAHLETAAGRNDPRDLSRAEVPNIFAAFDRVHGKPGTALQAARLVASVRSSLVRRGPLVEGLDRSARARASLAAEDIAADPLAVVRLELCRSRLTRALGDWKAALGIAEEAVRLARLPGAAAILAEALWEEGYLAGAFSDYARSDRAIEECERLARAAGQQVRVLSALHLKTVRLRARGDGAGSVAAAREALELSRAIEGRPDVVAESLNVLANALHETDDPAGAIALYREAMAIDERLGNDAGLALRYGNLGDTLQEAGDYRGAMEVYARAEEIDRRLGRAAFLMYTLIRRAGAVRALGDPAESLRLLDEARVRLDQFGGTQLGVVWRLRRLETLLALGRNEEAAAEAGPAIEAARKDEDLAKVLAASVSGATALLRLGRPAEARALLEREAPGGTSANAPTSVRFELAAVRARVAEEQGPKEEARRLAGEAASLLADVLRTNGPGHDAVVRWKGEVERMSRGG